MKRPKQHIIETQSRKIFEGILPSEWALNKIELDYGNDFLVELFDSNFQSTGKYFFVQLKGSEQGIIDDKFKKQFSIKNLGYYASQPLPCLIVCVSTIEEKVWGI